MQTWNHVKSLENSVRDYMICQIIRNSILLITFTEYVLFFKDFKALKKNE